MLCTYLAHSLVGSLAAPEMVYAYSIYLILISWSVVAETFVFSMLPKFQLTENKNKLGLRVICKALSIDPIVILSLIVLNFIYFVYANFGQKDFVHLVAVMFALTLAFFLRISEANAKAICSRVGAHLDQQIIVNGFTSIKVFFVILCIFWETEILIYLVLSVLSVFSIKFLVRKAKFDLAIHHSEKQKETHAHRWLMLLSLSFGTLSFQLDKFVAVTSDEEIHAAQYILTYSLVFLIFQGLSPLYNRYISNLWVDQEKKQISYENKKWFKSTVQILSAAAVSINFLMIFTLNYFSNDKSDLGLVITNLFFLSLAVILCCNNTFWHFEFLAQKRFRAIFWMSLSGLIFGLIGVGVIINFPMWNYYSVVPLGVTFGTFCYLRYWELKYSTEFRVSTMELVRTNLIEQTSYCLALPFIALTCFLVNKNKISFLIFALLSIAIIMLHTYFASRNSGVPLIHSIKLILKKGDAYI